MSAPSRVIHYLLGAAVAGAIIAFATSPSWGAPDASPLTFANAATQTLTVGTPDQSLADVALTQTPPVTNGVLSLRLSTGTAACNTSDAITFADGLTVTAGEVTLQPPPLDATHLTSPPTAPDGCSLAGNQSVTLTSRDAVVNFNTIDITKLALNVGANVKDGPFTIEIDVECTAKCDGPSGLWTAACSGTCPEALVTTPSSQTTTSATTTPTTTITTDRTSSSPSSSTGATVVTSAAPGTPTTSPPPPPQHHNPVGWIAAGVGATGLLGSVVVHRRVLAALPRVEVEAEPASSDAPPDDRWHATRATRPSRWAKRKVGR